MVGDSCSDFAVNAYCNNDGTSGFCDGSRCQPAVRVGGGYRRLNGGLELNGKVAAKDRDFIDPVRIRGTEFTILVPESETELVIELNAGTLLPVWTRPLSMTGLTTFSINNDPINELRVMSKSKWDSSVEIIEETPSAERGVALLRIKRNNRSQFINAKAALISLQNGVAPPRALYFRGPPNQLVPAPLETTTAKGKATVMFPFTLPGRYRVDITTPDGSTCHGAGPDQPSTVSIMIGASTLTEIGDIICDLPNARTDANATVSMQPGSGNSGRLKMNPHPDPVMIEK